MGNWVSGLSTDRPRAIVRAETLGPPSEGDKVLIPVDGSSHAANAVDYYLSKLHKSGVELVFLHVVEPPCMTGQVFSDIEAINDLERRVEECRKAATVLENKYVDKAKEYGVEKYRMLGTEGNTGESIIRAAMWEKPTMIVMGSRGLGPIARTVLGSVSHYVISHSDVPVLIYKTRRKPIINILKSVTTTKDEGDKIPKDRVHRFA